MRASVSYYIHWFEHHQLIAGPRDDIYNSDKTWIVLEPNHRDSAPGNQPLFPILIPTLQKPSKTNENNLYIVSHIVRYIYILKDSDTGWDSNYSHSGWESCSKEHSGIEKETVCHPESE